MKKRFAICCLIITALLTVLISGPASVYASEDMAPAITDDQSSMSDDDAAYDNSGDAYEEESAEGNYEPDTAASDEAYTDEETEEAEN